MDDGEAVEKLRDGDTGYFEYLVDCYYKKIYAFIYHMINNRQEAEDLTQDVFCKVYKNLFKLNSGYMIKPWIYKIAYNTALNYIRKNKNPSADVEIEKIASCTDSIGDFETRYAVLKEIESFKPDCRAIFILKFIEDLSFEQIAVMLGKSTPSVKHKFYRNRKALIKKLGKSFMEV